MEIERYSDVGSPPQVIALLFLRDLGLGFTKGSIYSFFKLVRG